MANKRVYVICDTETTGFMGTGAEIVEIAAKALNPWDFSDHHAGTFHCYIKPQRPEKASAKALEVIGDVWAKANSDEALHPKVAYQKMVDYFNACNPNKSVFESPIFVGHNSKGFDMPFITASLMEYGIIKDPKDTPWSMFSLDTMDMMIMLWESDPDVHRFKLDNLLEIMAMGRKAKTHGALEDVELTAKAFVRLMTFFRACRKSMRLQPVLGAKTKEAE